MHNEAELARATVSGIVEGARARQWSFELVVVENGSTDTTRTLLDELQASAPELRVVSLPIGDYGAALHAGLDAATGRAAAVFDADLWNLDLAELAFGRMNEPNGPAIVIASKRADGTRDERSALRRLATATFTGLLHAAVGLRASDTHGMKVVRLDAPMRALIGACTLTTDLFDTELVVRTERAGLRIDEVPCVIEELRPPRSALIKRVPRTLKGIIRLRRTLGRAG